MPAAAPPATDAKQAGPATKPPAPAPARAATQAPVAGAGPAQAAAGGQAASSQRFDRMAVRAKLAVSQPGDAAEQEADAVAAHVMRSPAPAPGATRLSSPGPTPQVQRRARPELPADPGAAPETSADLVSRLGAGAPLDPATRAYFEPRLGTDLGHVRVHHDGSAADAARTLQARAFTFGHHVAFASGEFAPHEPAGRALLAHELAHVLQNDTLNVSAVVRRKADSPKYENPTDISEDGFDPALDKAARPALQTLNLPAIKARHADIYKGLARGESLKRPAGYDRRKPPFQTQQVKNWNAELDLTPHYPGIGFVQGAGRQSLTFFGAKPRPVKGTEGEIIQQLKVPNWSPDGTWSDAPLQVDHIVEVQLNGADNVDNYELLTGAHNTNVGSLLRAAIYANVKTYLGAVGKNVGDSLVKEYLETYDVPFKRVAAGVEGKNPERTARFWSRKEITAGKHLVWLKDEKREVRDDGNQPNRFALYAHTGEGFIDAFNLHNNKVSAQDSGRLAGIKVKGIALTANLASINTGRIGTLTGAWELPRNVEVDGSSTVSLGLDAVPGKKYAGKLADAVEGPKLSVKGASPVTFGAMDFVRGKLSGDGVLTTSHELFAGLQIPVRWRGDELAFEYTVPVQALQGKLPVPGLKIDDASLTLFLTRRGIGADGMLSFSVVGLGAGVLTVGVQARAGGPEITAEGRFIADRKLFDQATLVIGYSSKKGFHGHGVLGITTPGKVKGLKSARLKAGYEQGVFSAAGDVVPDVPGLKSASLTVSYGERLVIGGQLALDERVPGVEAADITVTVTEGEGGWKVAASGDVTPKLPGLAGAKLKFSYDDGAVLLQGTFAVSNRLLNGTVTAGVTNAPVNDHGQPLSAGEGHTFTLFGSADLGARFGPLKGSVRLIVKPDGRVLVGGKLAMPDQQLFGQHPEGPAARHYLCGISTPAIPLVGFSVAGVGVGLLISAGGDATADAAVGPGVLKDVLIEVEPFDLESFNPARFTVNGGARLVVYAQAALQVAAWIKAELDIGVARAGGKLVLTGKAGLPADRPVLDAQAKFKWSESTGLDVAGQIRFNATPRLQFELAGELYAKVGRWRFTYTVWSRKYSFGQVAYDLPVPLHADAALAWNSKTGFNFDPKAVFLPPKPDLRASDMKALADSGPQEKTADVLDEEDRPQGEPPAPVALVHRQALGAGLPPIGISEGDLAALGSGRPLPDATRVDFEQRLHSDLSAVRVHDSEAAAALAQRVNARAFAVGDTLVFNHGEYQPGTEPGRELLAHELAHVLQHREGAARTLQRQPDTAPAGGAPADAAAPAGAPVGRGPITLPQLKVPELKYTSTADNQHRMTAYDNALAANVERPAGYRRADVDSRQRTLWTQATPAATLRTALATKVPGLDAEKVYVGVPRGLTLAGAGNQVIVGNPGEIALALRQPRWDRQGQADPHPFEIDHIVELQIGGPAYDRIDNLELLERAANGASGRAIDGFMDRAFAEYLASTEAAALPVADRTAEVLKRQYRVRFGSFVAHAAPATGKRWTQPEVLAADPVDGLHLYDPTDLAGGATADPNATLQAWPAGVDAARFTGSPTMLVVYASPRGGEPRPVPLQDGRPVDAAGVLRGWLPGIETQELGLTLSAAADGPIGRVRGRLVHEQLAPDARIDVDIPIRRRRGLANAGVLNTDALQDRLRGLLRSGGVTALSPVVVDEVDVLPGVGLFIAGRVEPTIAMLRGASLDFQVRGAELIVSKTFSGAEVALGGPLRVEGSDLTVAIGTRSGLSVDGGVAFGIDRLGRGTLRGAGRSGEFAVNGRFDFDPTLFDADANIQLGYRRGPDAPDGKLSGSGTVSIGPGKVRGIRRATVQAAFDGEQRSVQGSAELDIPGVESAQLGVQFTPEGGTQITGSARFRDTPGIRNGQISATLTQADGQWRLAASGSAQAAFAGITTTLAASYDDGLFMFAADAPFAVGDRVSGNVRVGVTNGQVDDAGQLLPGSGPAPGAASSLRPFGNGRVNVRITDWLQGGVGLRVRPTGELLVSGRIGIPAPVTVFEQYPSPERARRTLFEMPMVSVPLVGLSVGSTVVGVALTINGRVTGQASIGPGRLTQTEIAIEDFNPARPETLHVTGGAIFDLPAQAGIAATLDAGVTLGAAIVRATAGVSLSAEAGLQAHVTPQVDIDWRAASGLHLHAALDASLAPRLAFDVNGYAEVVANAFVTSFTLWRKDWNLAHREVGSSLALRMNVPVDYYSDGRGVVFDPAAVRLDVPPLDGSLLDGLLNDEGGTERVERAPATH